MQVGFNPINFNQQRQNRVQNTNFGVRIPVKLSADKPTCFVGAIGRGVHEDSSENRALLKQVLDRMRPRSDAKFDVPDIKEAIFKKWGKDKEIEEMFKGY